MATKEHRYSLGRTINLNAAKRNTAQQDADENEIFAAECPLWAGKLGRPTHVVKKGATMRVTWHSGTFLPSARCYVAGKPDRLNTEKPKPKATRKKGASAERRGSGCVWNVSGPHRVRTMCGPHGIIPGPIE